MILSYADYEPKQRFDADIIVVGTGAGGGAIGTELAEAGHDVLFLEEGSHHATASFSPYTVPSVTRLYRDAGTTAILGTPPIPFVEGRCVGGSTVINGGMTYRPPDRVLEAWRQQTGCPDLDAAGLEKDFERVEAVIGAAPQSPGSVGEDSRILEQGAKRLGWRYVVNLRNQRQCTGANNCAFGCPTGAKQSTLLSYLPRAFLHGARCASNVRVDRILIRNGRAVGIRGRAIDPVTRKPGASVTAHARAVILACGAIQTPYLLQRHRAGRPSGQLGRNFRCHPNAKVIAIYPFEVHGWKGVSQYGQIREFIDAGILFAENFVPAGALAANLGQDGQDAWSLMTRYNQMVVSGVLVEDSTAGSVSRSLLGTPFVRYDISAWDHARFIRGIELLTTLHFEMGAERVVLPLTSDSQARSLDEARKRLARCSRREELELFTVHLMGTARLGSDPRASVVDPNGQVWDLPGCFVADASLFPTAIGVNPQVTIMAMATRLARRFTRRRAAA